jgi:HEAT repeat protein
MSGLAIRGTPAADAPVRAALADPHADPVVRRGAARALAAGWLEPEGGPNLDALAAALADSDPLTREAVVKALAPHAARPAVRDALAARLPKEDAPLVREALEQALKTETP